MKALSLKQPFVELILQGKKTIELRRWNTHFRGEFLLHASQTLHAKAMKEFGFDMLPTGYIVGKATLVDVKHYRNEHEHRKDEKHHLATSFWGTYGLVLRDVQRFKEPIPCKGSLNFWEFSTP